MEECLPSRKEIIRQRFGDIGRVEEEHWKDTGWVVLAYMGDVNPMVQEGYKDFK